MSPRKATYKNGVLDTLSGAGLLTATGVVVAILLVAAVIAAISS